METPESLKDRYNKVAKTYKLPSWEVLDKEFEILYSAPVMEIKYPIAFVARRVGDKLNKILEMLHAVINPPQNNIVLMKNHSFLGDDDKKAIFKMITTLMRGFTKTNMTTDMSEKTQVEELKSYLDTYKNVKKPYISVMNRIKLGWKKTSKEKH